MKKIIIFLLCFATVFLCSCGSEYSIDGYENFQTSHSHYELNHYLVPSLDFTELFQYTDIDYYYREEYNSLFDFTERSFLVVKYEKQIYEQAKEYCFQNMQLSDTNFVEYNEYVFIENTELATKQDRNGTLSSFPNWFNMFSYNDNSNSLLFLGFYNSNYTSDDAQNVRDNWGAFLEKHFSDIYDWEDKGNDSVALKAKS